MGVGSTTVVILYVNHSFRPCGNHLPEIGWSNPSHSVHKHPQTRYHIASVIYKFDYNPITYIVKGYTYMWHQFSYLWGTQFVTTIYLESL